MRVVYGRSGGYAALGRQRAGLRESGSGLRAVQAGNVRGESGEGVDKGGGLGVVRGALVFDVSVCEQPAFCGGGAAV